jgi:hypothetical protein
MPCPSHIGQARSVRSPGAVLARAALRLEHLKVRITCFRPAELIDALRRHVAPIMPEH